MSLAAMFHPHPLRQSHTLEVVPPDNNISRQLSTTSSSASSGYSYASDQTQNTQHSTLSSAYWPHKPTTTIHTHKRGQSDVIARARLFESGEMSPSTRDAASARQSLRQLPQAPAASLHRPPPASPEQKLRHLRGQSVDMSKLSISQTDGLASPASPPRMSSMRPNSMLLTRSDSVLRGPGAAVPSSSAHIGAPELEQLGRSSTTQLRNLSKLAQSNTADEFAITSPTQEVVGLRGRRKLQRAEQPAGGKATKSIAYGWGGRNWMDKQRQFLQAYEYLCHIGEAREWIGDITNKSLPPIVSLEEALRDGVTLAEVVEALNPDRHFRIFRHPKLQFRHSDNIAIFFRYLDEVEMPDLFRFELIDLYEKKNIPKVIYCIHALSWLLFRKGIVDFRIGNLIGQLEFEHHELEAVQKGLDKLGASMPSFGNMGADFGVPEPEPQETEEEKVDRELAEQSTQLTDLQAQIRGALARLRLGDTMSDLWEGERALINLQARIRGDFTRQIMGYRLQMRRSSIMVQSAARGFLIRRHMKNDERRWRAIEPDVMALQSIMRANKARNEVRDLTSVMSQSEGAVREIQAMSRGFLIRKDLIVQKRETKQASGDVLNLQALARGALLRDQMDAQRDLLAGFNGATTRLQAAARAVLTRNQISRERKAMDAFIYPLTLLQSLVSGKAARANHLSTKMEVKRHSLDIGMFQAAIRAAAVRCEIASQLDSLHLNEPGTVELQSRIRGMFERRSVFALQNKLDSETSRVTSLQGRIRAFNYRRQHRALMQELVSHDAKTAAFQAMLKAMMERARVDDLLTELFEEEETIVELQSAARAFLVRARFEEKKRFFDENMQKVIKIQSFVRAKVQGEAYKSLTTGKNPPVNAVKNFVHLLNDSDFDFNEEVEFERMRKTVVQQVRQNEMLEQYIDQLDIKIALLVKNKITLDEVVSHQHNYGGGPSMGMLANSSISSTNQFDLKALNKGSRKKLESYQQLFFCLQTQPQYLARLFKRLREQGTPDGESKRIELLVMAMFGYAQKRREEYYLLKLIARSIREEIEGSRNLQEYQRGTFFWSKLLANYTRSPRDRKFLRGVLGPLVRDNIVEDPALDLESDPMQIYRAAINNEELRTGRPDGRPLDVPREVAIRDPETRRLFIDHLRDLREICDQFFLAMQDHVFKTPYGLRFLCRQMFDSLRQHFNRDSPDILLQLVTNWYWKFYLQPAIVSPENVGVIEKTLSPLQKRNLGEVAKVIGQIASGRPFGGENVYLQPLNAFVAESVERLRRIVSELINVPDAESTFDIDEFNDLYAKNKPTLYIKMADVFAIHNLIVSQLPFICPTRDDVLREIIQDLGSAKTNESEMSAAGSSDIQMFLTPKLHDVEDPDAEVKALFMETKRCVLYIIRVQTGANLLEILVKPITDEDDAKWAALLQEDFAPSGSHGAYSDSNMVDVTRMSYYELKRTALENVMRLEQMGRISKHNNYQDILNAIASDIRSKSKRRGQRQRELEGVNLTLGNLHEKANYLEQQRKSYDDYIEQAMMTLQNKKGKKRFLMPFTKQYNHQRELERSGKVPKFGSFMYSARSLSDKGVLVLWKGMSDWEKINVTISCDQVGVFVIEGTRGHVQMPGASAVVNIEDLLQAQFEAHQFVHLFEGNLKLNVNFLLHLVYKKFYRTQ